MGWNEFIVSCAVSAAIAYIIGLKDGKREGKRLERLRCQTVLSRSLNVRYSPTTREALVCISGHQTEEEMEAELNRITEVVDQMNKSGYASDRQKEKADGE